jgi:Xaa-Pro aminopeptidase
MNKSEPLNTTRLHNLQNVIKERNLDALFIVHMDNIRYICDFVGTTAWQLTTANKNILAVDFRYFEQAKDKVKLKDTEIIQVKGEVIDWLPALIRDNSINIIGFESNYISYTLYSKLSENLISISNNIKLVPTFNIVESLRACKSTSEIELISQAVQLADSAFKHITEVIHPGMTEIDVAWQLEKYLRENGSEPVPFEIIVASGPNSAMPHAKSTQKQIEVNEPILIDLAAKVNGYCSDLSRTLFMGKLDKTFVKLYDIVLGAQLTALSAITSNITGKQADSLARSVIEHADFGKYFGHGLGHGVGLAIHEFPSLSAMSTDEILDSMIFTVEPGIYITGWGGIRIEDTVVIEGGKVRTLSNSIKTLNMSTGGLSNS